MKSIFVELRPSLAAAILLLVITCGAYPAAVWGVSQLLFPRQANGSLIARDGKVVGSGLLAQGCQGPGYFHPRPSAAGAGYDASSSGGSNLGPLSAKLLDLVKERVAAYRKENGLGADARVPADAVTSSGSGLDPHIGVQNALYQAPRVARTRSIPEETLRGMIREHTEGPDLWVLGEPGVNVLKLNLALDERSGRPK